MFSTVLVANRGEIAGRVFRTLRRMGIASVAVHSAADAAAPFVALADVAVRLDGPTPAAGYLDIEQIIAAAVRTGAEAIHPGYGFLAENAGFARACAAAGITFIGPGVHALEVMGDKIRAKQSVSARGVPVVPGLAEAGLTDAELITAAAQVGYPVLVKPSAGGGGKGMHVAHEPAELRAALITARREALASFGDDTLFVERFVPTPRHIEVQVLADNTGHTIHLGERECSLQRRHQKIIEESPSPLLDAQTRDRIGQAACETARAVDYRGAGTVEFIVPADAPDDFSFMEMNTRLQVEHPVTEMVTGVDLVEWQIRIAAGEPLTLHQDDIVLTGHATEARVYAEDPARGFLPTGGTIGYAGEPTGEGIRVDSGIATGVTITPDYDPMLAKVIAWAPTREQSLARLRVALGDTVILGVRTNLEFLGRLLAEPEVVSGNIDTGLVERLPAFAPPDLAAADLATAAMIVVAERWPATPRSLWEIPDGWRLGGRAPHTIRLEQAGADAPVVVAVTGDPAAARVSVAIDDHPPTSFTAAIAIDGHRAVVQLDGVARKLRWARDADRLWWTWSGRTFSVDVISRALRSDHALVGIPELRAPMPGTVVAVAAETGTVVAEGEAVLVMEAMKMEHTLRATVAGVVDLLVAVGSQVRGDQVLATLDPTSDPVPTP